MKNKVLFLMLAIIFIIAIVMTFAKGLKVDLYYGEGYTIKVTEKDSMSVEDVKSIAKEIWGNQVLVQNIEFFNDSVEIKVRDYNDDQLTQLKDKLNEKYSSDLEISDLNVDHVSNVKIKTLVEPYIIPMGLSLLLILAYYAIRYRGARRMIELLLWILVVEGLMYSVYAIGRVPFNGLTLPIAVCLFVLTVILNSVKDEKISDED